MLLLLWGLSQFELEFLANGSTGQYSESVPQMKIFISSLLLPHTALHKWTFHFWAPMTLLCTPLSTQNITSLQLKFEGPFPTHLYTGILLKARSSSLFLHPLGGKQPFASEIHVTASVVSRMFCFDELPDYLRLTPVS